MKKILMMSLAAAVSLSGYSFAEGTDAATETTEVSQEACVKSKKDGKKARHGKKVGKVGAHGKNRDKHANKPGKSHKGGKKDSREVAVKPAAAVEAAPADVAVEAPAAE